MELGTWYWGEHALTYEVHGDGPRTFVFIHGLLLPAGINRDLAVRIARRGHRVVLPELLGHGRSDRPDRAVAHRLEYYGDQVVALLDHLALDEAVVGGVSLGANVTLEVASRHPERLRGAVLEMPVLERGGVAAAVQFLPLLVALRWFPRTSRLVTRLIRQLPRTGWEAADAFLDAASGDPRSMAAVIHGLTAGPIAPSPTARRGIPVPSLVIGHPRDLIHPLDDALALAEELPDAELLRARSMLEARTRPDRVAEAIANFLDAVWQPRAARTRQA